MKRSRNNNNIKDNKNHKVNKVQEQQSSNLPIVLTSTTSITDHNNNIKKKKNDNNDEELIEKRQRSGSQRSRGSSKRNQPPPVSLGVSEFAATIQSDNIYDTIHSLKRFIQMIRFERNQTLLYYDTINTNSTVEEGTNNNMNNTTKKIVSRNEDDDDNNLDDDEKEDEDLEDEDDGDDYDDDDDDDDVYDHDIEDKIDDDDIPSTTTVDSKVSKKKQNKMKDSNDNDNWKNDTSNYNVPFIGTSISTSAKYDSGKLVAGQWPTGFIQHYINKSPLAIELTSNIDAFCNNTNSKKKINKKDKKISLMIYKLYLCALEELITAAIPIERLLIQKQTKNNVEINVQNIQQQQAHDNNNTNNNRYMNEIIMKCLPIIYTTLRQETNHGKGKLGGDCGLLTPIIIRILHNISLTSIPNAITIIKSLQTIISDDIIQFLYRPSLNSKTSNNQNNNVTKHIKKNDKIITQESDNIVENPITSRQISRMEMLKFTSSMLHMSITTTTTTNDSNDSNNTNSSNNSSLLLSMICSNGSKEKKLFLGILHVACKHGIIIRDELQKQKHTLNDDSNINNNRYYVKYHNHLYMIINKLLYQFYLLLIMDHHSGHNSQKKVYEQSITELFSRDAIQNICQFMKWASPTLIRYDDVLLGLDGEDELVNTNSKQHLGIQARRIIFRLLIDIEKSPLLRSIQRKKRFMQIQQQQQQRQHDDDTIINNNNLDKMTHNNNNDATYEMNIMIHCIMKLLIVDDGDDNPDDDHHDNNNQQKSTVTLTTNLEMQRFISYVLSITPLLLPKLLQHPSIIPTVNHVTSRITYAFITRMSFIGKTLRDGPSPFQCLLLSINDRPIVSSSSVPSNNVSYQNIMQYDDETILHCIAPIRSLKKQMIIKILLTCPNRLIVIETLKLIICILRRYQQYQIEIKGSGIVDTNQHHQLATLLYQQLPDWNVLIRTLSRFNYDSPTSITTNKRNNDNNDDEIMTSNSSSSSVLHANSITYAYICQVLQEYVIVFASNNNNNIGTSSTDLINIDWLKIMPDHTESFCSSPIIIQRKILSTIESLLSIQESMQNFRINAFRSILSCMLVTESDEILNKLRSIAFSVLVKLLLMNHNSNGDTDKSCNDVIEYEITCWLESVTMNTLNEYCSLIEQCITDSYMSVIVVAQAWNNAKLPNPMPPLTFSSLLVHAIRNINQSSKAFSICTCQIAIKCIMYMNNPLPLAALILDSYDSTGKTTSSCIPEVHNIVRQYAQSLIDYNNYSGTTRIEICYQMLHLTFGENSLLRLVVQVIRTSGMIEIDTPKGILIQKLDGLCLNYLALSRNIKHFLFLTDTDHVKNNCLHLMKCILPALLKTMKSRNVEPIVTHCDNLRTYHSFRVIDLLLLTSSSNDKRIGRSMNISIHEKTLVDDAISSFQRHIPGQDNDLTEDFTKAMYHLYFIGPFLSLSSIERMLTEVVKIDFNLFTRYIPIRLLVIQYLNFFLEKQDYDGNCSLEDKYGLLRLIFDMFDTCISHKQHDRKMLRLCMTLEKVIHKYLTCCKESMFLSTKSAGDVVDKIIHIHYVAITNGYSQEQHVPLLEAMVNSDAIKYAPDVIKYLATCNEAEFKILLEQESVANALLASIPVCIKMERNLEHCKVTLARIVTMLTLTHSRIPKSGMMLDNFTSILERLICCKLLLDTSNTKDLINLVLRVILNQSPLVTKFDKLSTKVRVNYLRIGCCISQVESVVGIDQVSSVVLDKLMLVLPSSLKFHLKEVQDSKKKQYVEPTAMFQLLREILLATNKFRDVLEIDSTVVSGLVKACLKYGINCNDEVNDDTLNLDISLLCIKQVNTTIDFMSNKSSGPFIFNQQKLESYLADLFYMITTHSKFSSLMSSQCFALKLEVANLIEICLRMTEIISFDFSIWVIFISAFNAGVTSFDERLRRILCIYGKKAPEGSPALYLDQYRWGSVDCRKETENDWNWFVGTLDLRRVYSTIAQFPIDFSRNPLSSNEHHDVYASEIEEIYDSDKTSVKTENELDNRYNPGFILPMILGVLDDYAQTNQKEPIEEPVANEEGDDEIEPMDEDVEDHDIDLIKSLYERGALALALCSLCSNSSSIRRISFAIIGQFYRAVTSKVSHGGSQWRERPQIEMLLNSVIRAFIILRAEDNKEGNTETPLDVPKMTGFSAVFLAKASFILSRPADPLYVTTNRFFLRVETDHGAFQDTFKLPGFLHLFCSSAHDSDQLISERKFAIELVRDGFVDEDSYKLLVKGYVPDILLTSLESIKPGRPDKRDREPCLILETLTKIINVGGNRSRHHLIGRLGILSWIRSYLAKDQCKALLYSIRSRVVLAQFITSAVEKATNEFTEDEISIYISGCAQAVLELCLATVSTKEKGHNDYLASSMITQTCHLLNRLTMATVNEELLKDQSCFQSGGVRIETAVKLLLLIPPNNTALRQRTVHALCNLPFEYESFENVNNKQDFVNFCTFVLDVALAFHNSETSKIGYKTFVISVLRRISSLSSLLQMPESFNMIFPKLFAWRSHCSYDLDVRSMYFKCLTCIWDRRKDISDKKSDEASGNLFLPEYALLMERS